MSDETSKPRCVGIVSMDDESWELLTRTARASPMRVYNGNALNEQLMRISIALQDISRVRSETAEIIAEDLEQRVFGLIASLLGIDDKGGAR